MRSIDEINELSYESFIETYGKVHGSYHQAKGAAVAECDTTLPQISVTGEDGEKLENVKSEDFQNNNGDACGSRKSSIGVVSIASSCDSGSDNPASSKSRSGNLLKKTHLRKISIEKLTSLGGAIQAAVNSRRPKSHSFSEKSGISKPKPNRRISGLIPGSSLLPRKGSADSGSLSTEEGDSNSGTSDGKVRTSARPNSVCLPASRLGSCSHRGFLDCRNKKKQWEKYWCVLHDACLYCYHSPQSDVARDVIMLRGYDVIADVTNLNRSRFVIRLQQQGFPKLYFSSDNYRDYLLWAGSLEKETRTVMLSGYSSMSEIPTSNTLSTSTNEKNHSVNLQNLKISDSQEQPDSDLLLLQKKKLLEELAQQKEHIAEEQKMLERFQGFSSSNLDRQSSIRKYSREDIVDRYEKDRIQQELKSTEFLTLLNRRRNSCHLKMTQYAKSLSPNACERNSENNAAFSSMEKKLKELQEALLLIDREFEEEEATKQHNLERLQRKRDLQLLIIEQRETIDLMRQLDPENKSDSFRSFAPSMTPSSTRSRDTLGSIDEISDDLVVTSSTPSLGSSNNFIRRQDAVCSSSSSSDLSSPIATSYGHPLYTRSASDPGKDLHPADSQDRGKSSDEDSGFQPSTGAKMAEDSYQFYRSVLKTFFPSPEHKPSLNRKLLLDSDSLLDLSSKESTLKAHPSIAQQSEIDSEVLAKIEDFETFAKMKLKKATKSNGKP